MIGAAAAGARDAHIRGTDIRDAWTRTIGA